MRPLRSFAVALTSVVFSTGAIGTARADPPAPISAPAPPPDAAPSVLVHLAAPAGAGLEVRSRAVDGWEPACASPCDTQVPLGREYRIAGYAHPSEPFQLQGQPGKRVVLRVETTAPSKTGVTAGVALTAGGGAVALAGLIVFLDGALTCPGDPSSLGDNATACDPRNAEAGVRTTGATIGLIGAGILVAGIVVLVVNASQKAPLPKVSETVAGWLTPSSPRAETASVRAPVWHEATREPAGGASLFGTTTLFSRSF